MDDTTETAEGTEAAPTAPTAAPDGFVSQADLDRIVQDRLARQSKKYADYEELRAAADKWAQLEESQKTELQRAQDSAQDAQSELSSLRQRLRDTTVSNAVTQAAAAAGAVNPAQVVKLMDLDVELDESGAVITDVAAAVNSFLAENQHLVAAAAAQQPLPPVAGNSKPAVPGTSFTLEDIAKMDPRELARNPEALKAAIEARNLLS